MLGYGPLFERLGGRPSKSLTRNDGLRAEILIQGSLMVICIQKDSGSTVGFRLDPNGIIS